jgi:hypothetical protein
MLPGKIRAQVEYMKAHPDCVLCYHDLIVFDSDTGRHLGNWVKGSGPRSGALREFLKHPVLNGACATMVRRSATPAEGFDPRIPIASDWLFWAEMLVGGGEFHYLNLVLGKYRRHAQNVTGLNNKRLRLNFEDHFNSAAILLMRYPEYSASLRGKMASALRAGRLADPSRYARYLRTSLQVKFNFKSLVLLAAFLATAGRLRR